MTPFEQLYLAIPVVGIAVTAVGGWLALRYLDRRAPRDGARAAE